MAYAEAKTREKAGRRKLHEVRIRKADGGGHIVEHHYKGGEMEFMGRPEEKVFTDGHEMLAHIGNKMGVGKTEDLLAKLNTEHESNEEEPGGDEENEHGEEEVESVPEEEFEEHEQRA